METTLDLTVTKDFKDGSKRTQELAVDNSTDLKDFYLSSKLEYQGKTLDDKVVVQLNEGVISINNVVLEGIILDTFKKFIKQIEE